MSLHRAACIASVFALLSVHLHQIDFNRLRTETLLLIRMNNEQRSADIMLRVSLVMEMENDLSEMSWVVIFKCTTAESHACHQKLIMFGSGCI